MKTMNILSVLAVLCLSFPAIADDSASAAQPKKHHHHHHMKKVIQACAKANDITLPAKGSGQSLSVGDRTALHACVQQFHASLQACAQNAGLSKPEPGQKPSDADKAAFKQCWSESLSGISAS